jgi:hypothetical protein
MEERVKVKVVQNVGRLHRIGKLETHVLFID